MGCASGAVGASRWKAAGAGRRVVAGRVRTNVHRGKGGVPPGRVLCMRNITSPLRSGPGAGKPTVRKAQPLSGRTMTQQANAGTSKGDRKTGPYTSPFAGGLG